MWTGDGDAAVAAGGRMAARAFMEQIRTAMLQRRVRETQSRSEPAGAFQSLIAHIINRDRGNHPKIGWFQHCCSTCWTQAILREADMYRDERTSRSASHP